MAEKRSGYSEGQKLHQIKAEVNIDFPTRIDLDLGHNVKT